MMSAGRPTFSIVQAIVAVFPVPVAPTSVCIAVAGLEAFGEGRDRRRLVAGRSIGGVCFELGHLGQG